MRREHVCTISQVLLQHIAEAADGSGSAYDTPAMVVVFFQLLVTQAKISGVFPSDFLCGDWSARAEQGNGAVAHYEWEMRGHDVPEEVAGLLNWCGAHPPEPSSLM